MVTQAQMNHFNEETATDSVVTGPNSSGVKTSEDIKQHERLLVCDELGKWGNTFPAHHIPTATCVTWQLSTFLFSGVMAVNPVDKHNLSRRRAKHYIQQHHFFKTLFPIHSDSIRRFKLLKITIKHIQFIFPVQNVKALCRYAEISCNSPSLSCNPSTCLTFNPLIRLVCQSHPLAGHLSFLPRTPLLPAVSKERREVKGVMR